LDGNQRLRHVHGQFADVWIDTSDVSRALPTQRIRKKLNWRCNRIELDIPDSYATYVQYMEAQWQYGYQRGMEALQRPCPSDNTAMRQVNRYNRAEPCAF
jgi:hypothetical protein